MRIIAGEARGRKLTAPRDDSIRPLLDRIRESLFSTLEGSFEERRVLDLFAGVGSFGLEALSRGARRVVFVDKEPSSLAILQRNIETLGFAPRADVIRGDALKSPVLESVEPPGFALAFLDPPFRMFDRERDADVIFQRVRAILESQALEQGGIVLLRHPSRFRGALPIEAAGRKAYGESVVLRFERGAPGAGGPPA